MSKRRTGRLSLELTRKMTGLIGLCGAVLVGGGEFLLHFDPLARFGEGYAFMADIPDQRLTLGHFLAAVGIPLYFVGLWHIYQMTKEGSQKIAFAAFAIGAYGFVMGAIWIGSRASIGSLQHHPELLAGTDLVALYDLRYETLLQVIRITTLILSAIYVYLVLRGGTRYPKWMAAVNPFALIIASFLIYLVVPAVGKYMMPIALNIAFGVFFACSLGFGRTHDAAAQ